MVSVEGLAKLVDPSQLTDDFEGSLDYNHEEWMDLRVSLEEFMSNAVHLLSRLEDLQVGCAHNVHRRLKEQPPKTAVYAVCFRSCCPRRSSRRTWRDLAG